MQTASRTHLDLLVIEEVRGMANDGNVGHLGRRYVEGAEATAIDEDGRDEDARGSVSRRMG